MGPQGDRASPRRRLLVGLALLLLASSALLVSILLTGLSIWPAAEDVRRIGSPPAEVEAALAHRDPKAPLRIGIVGDIQHGVSELADLLDAHREARVDLLLQLGDAANKGRGGRYAVLRHLFETHAAGIPVLAVPGNHDIEPADTLAVWNAWVGPGQWRVDVRGWRLLGLDDAAGTVSSASMDLARAAAADEHPPCGTLVVAHRPLAAPEDSSPHDPEAVAAGARARQFARSGLTPTLTLSGHWHRNVTWADDRGTVHVVLGENCDRASHGDNPDISVATLVLQPAVAEGVPAASAHEVSIQRIPRRITLRGEFLRLGVAEVYAWFRETLVLGWALCAVLAAGGALCLRAAWRRTDASPA